MAANRGYSRGCQSACRASHCGTRAAFPGDSYVNLGRRAPEQSSRLLDIRLVERSLCRVSFRALEVPVERAHYGVFVLLFPRTHQSVPHDLMFALYSAVARTKCFLNNLA